MISLLIERIIPLYECIGKLGFQCFPGKLMFHGAYQIQLVFGADAAQLMLFNDRD